MNKKDYSLFYDTSCCDMVSRYAAIKSTIGSRPGQESAIPISIGGVENTQVKSNHRVFQVKVPLINDSEQHLVEYVLIGSQLSYLNIN